MNFILNIKKSVDDERDWIYGNGISNSNILKSCDYRNELQPIRDQGSQGTCYAQSVSCMKEWQERKNYGLNEYLSPQFFYNNRDYWNNNKQDGDDKLEDYGMTGRDVMKILQNVGICKESEYPYGLKEKINEISQNIKDSAIIHRIKNYARITSLNGLKESLLKNGPCLIAFPVYNYTGQMWIKKEGNKQKGGHAMTVVGYDDDKAYFIIRNSWGSDWNDKGYCYYYYSDWESHWEVWTTVDLNIVVSEDESNDDINTDDSDSDHKPGLKIPEGEYYLIWGEHIGKIIVSVNNMNITINDYSYDYIYNKYTNKYEDTNLWIVIEFYNEILKTYIGIDESYYNVEITKKSDYNSNISDVMIEGIYIVKSNYKRFDNKKLISTAYAVDIDGIDLFLWDGFRYTNKKKTNFFIIHKKNNHYSFRDSYNRSGYAYYYKKKNCFKFFKNLFGYK